MVAHCINDLKARALHPVSREPTDEERSSHDEALAWALVALTFGCLLAAAALGIVARHSAATVVGDVVGIGLVLSIGFPLLGAFVIRRRGGHAVAWLMIAIGASIAFHTAVERWAHTALIDRPGSLPAGDFASWLSTWAWFPGWVLATTLLPVLFPDGRPRGRRRALARVDAIAVAALTLALAAFSWRLRGPEVLGTRSDAPGAATLALVTGVGLAVVALLSLASMGSLVARYRGAREDERRQIGWVVYGAAMAVVFGAVGMIPGLGGVVQVLQAGALVGGFAVAMFRHRLYDFDVVVNRTLVYGALTATLAGTYLVSVLALQFVLGGITGDSGLAVAASTLAVAALFRPARARIQAFVDRRFYRRKYDGQQTLEAFARRLRDEVALDALSSELRAVVTETMQPAHVSVWLRDARR
jgi:hypothetical protein